LAGPTRLKGTRMSVRPAATITSASPSFWQQRPTAPEHLAMGDLGILCDFYAPNGMPISRQRRHHRRLRSSASSRTTRPGCPDRRLSSRYLQGPGPWGRGPAGTKGTRTAMADASRLMQYSPARWKAWPIMFRHDKSPTPTPPVPSFPSFPRSPPWFPGPLGPWHYGGHDALPHARTHRADCLVGGFGTVGRADGVGCRPDRRAGCADSPRPRPGHHAVRHAMAYGQSEELLGRALADCRATGSSSHQAVAGAQHG
jgi:hypothetical protein